MGKVNPAKKGSGAFLFSNFLIQISNEKIIEIGSSARKIGLVEAASPKAKPENTANFVFLNPSLSHRKARRAPKIRKTKPGTSP